jgi:hypothetical protein
MIEELTVISERVKNTIILNKSVFEIFKVWDEEEQEWVVPKPETDEDDLIWEEEDDDDEFFDRENWEPDLGGTGHGDISYSDADPGL